MDDSPSDDDGPTPPEGDERRPGDNDDDDGNDDDGDVLNDDSKIDNDDDDGGLPRREGDELKNGGNDADSGDAGDDDGAIGKLKNDGILENENDDDGDDVKPPRNDDDENENDDSDGDDDAKPPPATAPSSSSRPSRRRSAPRRYIETDDDDGDADDDAKPPASTANDKSDTNVENDDDDEAKDKSDTNVENDDDDDARPSPSTMPLQSHHFSRSSRRRRSAPRRFIENDDDDDNDDDLAKPSRNDDDNENDDDNDGDGDDDAREPSTAPSPPRSSRPSRRRRSAPRRFVARPSKQGWGVDDGDEAFLKDDARFLAGQAPASAATSGGGGGSDAGGGGAGDGVADEARAAVVGGTEASAANPTKLVEPASKKAARRNPQQSRRSRSSPAAGSDSWECGRCGLSNLSSKARCSQCQGWRGGVRENIRTPKSKKRKSNVSGSAKSAPAAPIVAPAPTDGGSDSPGGKDGGRRERSTGDEKRISAPSRKRSTDSSSGGAGGNQRARAGAAGASSNDRTGDKRDGSNGRTSVMTRITTRSAADATDVAPSNAATRAAASSHTMEAFRHRRSNMSRRPRQPKPTEKMRNVMQEKQEARAGRTRASDARASSAGKRANGRARGRDRSSNRSARRPPPASPARASGAGGPAAATASSPTSVQEWQCARCDVANEGTRARCAGCQGWKGGRRENICSPSGKRGRSSRTPAESNPKKVPEESNEGAEGTRGTIVPAGGSATGGFSEEETGGAADGAGSLPGREKDGASNDAAADAGADAVGDDAAGPTEADSKPPPKKKKKKKTNAAKKYANDNKYATAGVKAKDANARNAKIETGDGLADDGIAAEEDEETNLDDVACCLCKCAVDFSDAHFFLPPEGTKKEEGGGGEEGDDGEEESDGENGGEQSDGSEDERDGKISFEGSEGGDDAKSPSGTAIASSAATSADASPAVASPAEMAADAAVAMATQADARRGHCEEKKDESDENEDGGKSTVSSELMGDQYKAKKEESVGNAKSKATECSGDESSEEEEEEEKPPFLLPRRFHDPNNALILCDGPVHAGKRRGAAGDHTEYRCDRAYHQRCHFVPVLTIPRGPWRCLICRHRDEAYLTEKAERKRKRKKGGGDGGARPGAGMGGDGAGAGALSDGELKAIYRCAPARPSEEGEEGETKGETDPAGAENADVADETPMDVAVATEKSARDGRLASKILSEGVAEGEGYAKGTEPAGRADAEGAGATCTKSAAEPAGETPADDGAPKEESPVDSKPNAETDEASTSELERRFESLSSPLKAHLLHLELTARAKATIRSALSAIRTAEHSLRSFTETSKARKALADRIECGFGLPQELSQCIARIAAAKDRVRGLVLGVEAAIRCRPSSAIPRDVPTEGARDEGDGGVVAPVGGGCGDVAGELLQWYLRQERRQRTLEDGAGAQKDDGGAQKDDEGVQKDDGGTRSETAADVAVAPAPEGKSLLQHLFPEGGLRRRRIEPRTDEARVHDEEAPSRAGRNAENADDDSSSSGISLDDLACACCLGSHSSDDNDMLLCDGAGCYRAFHMACLEPKMTREDVEGEDDWFCPLCDAHAELVHYAQREHLGDDWEELMRENHLKDWETAADVFPEASFELRVARKFKENEDVLEDEEAGEFLEDTLGIATGSRRKEDGARGGVNDIDSEEDDDEDDDDDFDQEEEAMDDCDSLAEDDHEERKLGKDTIGKDELDALSFTSEVGSEDDDVASSDEEDGSNAEARTRRSKRRRCALPRGESAGDDDSDSDERSGRSADMGALDAGNILRGKRNRTKVDYRKLADAMFGDESDEDAKGAKKEYTYRPRAKPARARKKDDEDDSSDDDDDETPKKKKARKVAPKNDKLEARVHEKNIREDGSDGDEDSNDDDDESSEKKRARKVAVK